MLDDDRLALDGILEYLRTEEDQLRANDPPLALSRAQKKACKGLPPWPELRKLAKLWMETAHALWPELVANGTLPEINPDTVEQLVRDYVRRFIEGAVDPYQGPFDKKTFKGLGVAHVRFSDANSNPASLGDQLYKILRKAASEGRFIPWEYVFADASVTGRTHLRRGYRLAKETFEQFKDTPLDSLYFNEFSRASRAAVETYRLAKLMERLRMRMIGASDGFVLGTEAARMQIMVAAAFNEWFIDQLRAKVMGGMTGAARRGTSLGKMRFGYKLVPLLDEHGNEVINSYDEHGNRHVSTPDD